MTEQARADEIDHLTGVGNRRALARSLDREVARAHRSARPLSLAFLDVAGFKRVNDEFGHTAGDDVLCDLAHRLVSVAGPGLAFRMAGGEFAVVLLSDLAGAVRLAERLREPLVVDRGHRSFAVEVRCGIAELQDGDDAAALVRRAERASLGDDDNDAGGGAGARQPRRPGPTHGADPVRLPLDGAA